MYYLFLVKLIISQLGCFLYFLFSDDNFTLTNKVSKKEGVAMSKIKDKELLNIAEIYNEKGRDAAYTFIEDQGIKYPYAVIKRMKNHATLIYKKETDTFSFQEKVESDAVFMTMDELCSPAVTEKKEQPINHKTVAMEKLIQDLLGDRLLEPSKYITLDSSSKTMMIDQTSLKSSGYKIVTY